MSDKVKIVAMTARHVKAVYDLAELSRLAHWSPDHYRTEIEKPDALCLTALDERNKIVGFLVSRLIKLENKTELYNIAVAEELRKRNIGANLLKVLFEQSRANNIETILLEVRESNRAARAFYRKFGFEILTIRQNFYRSPTEAALTMIARVAHLKEPE